MARSNVVWVVLNTREHLGPLAATFTVKHELKTWLAEQSYLAKKQMRFFRCPDNPRRYDNEKPVEIAMENFL